MRRLVLITAIASCVSPETERTCGSSAECQQDGGESAHSLDGPYAVAVAGGALYLSDGMNGRVLVWNAVPTANGAAADMAIGQASFTATSTATTAAVLDVPHAVVVAGGTVWAADAIACLRGAHHRRCSA